MAQPNLAGDARRSGREANGAVASRRVVMLPKRTTELIPFLRRRFDRRREGVVVVDSKEQVLYVNRAYTEMVGLDREEVMGRAPAFPWCVEGGVSSCGERYPGFVHSSNGAGCRPVWMDRQTILDNLGTTLAYALFFVDRTVTPEIPEAPDSPDTARLKDLAADLERIARALGELGVPTGPLPTRRKHGDWPELSTLSAREWDIVRPLLAGIRVASIARQLNISPHTVRNHLQSVFRKFGVSSQGELIEKLHSTPPRSLVATDDS
jgi:DNA-binding CsgD family transcriptional regulator